MTINLENKIALVARGNDNIGKAICAQLAELDAKVIALVAKLHELRQTRLHFEKTKSELICCLIN